MSKRSKPEDNDDAGAVRSLLQFTLGQVQNLSGGGGPKALSIAVAFDDGSEIRVGSNGQGGAAAETEPPKPKQDAIAARPDPAVRTVFVPAPSHEPSSAGNDYVDTVAREHGGEGAGEAHLVWFEGHEGSCRFGEEDRSDDWDDMDVTPPPPPPRDLHDKYGIGTNHADLNAAIAACKSGDIVYVMDTTLECFMNDELRVDKAVTIIGLGRSPDQTVLFRGSRHSIRVDSNVSFRNLTIRFGHQGRFGIQNDEANCDPLFSLNNCKAELLLDRCIIDMGSASAFEASRKIMRNRAGEAGLPGLHQSMISGIHVETAKSVAIQNCRFLGGCGSALTVICDPLLPSPSVQIAECTFEDMGQPSMEMPLVKGKKPSFGSTGCYSKTVEMLKKQGVALPATVEVWSVESNKYARRKESAGPRPDICLRRNTFKNNLQAPIAYRTIADLGLKGESKGGVEFTLLRSSNLGRDDDATHVHLKEVDIVVKDNTVVNNGLAFNGTKLTLSMKESRRSAVEDSDSDERLLVDLESTAFPDGDSVLIAGTFEEEFTRPDGDESDIFADFIYHDRSYEVEYSDDDGGNWW